MLILLILSFLSLVNSNLFFAPLFLFVYLYLIRRHYFLVLLLVGFSLLGDLIWVFPLGFSGFLFSLVLAAVSLYSHRYNVLNLWFLFGLLGVASLLMFSFARPVFSWWQILFFLGLFAWLRFEIRELHKKNLKNLL